LRDNAKLERCRSKIRPAPGNPGSGDGRPAPAGARAGLLLLEKLARQNRKRIPELIVHAKESTAYGTMTVPASTAQLGISGLSGALTFGTKRRAMAWRDR